jgi:hypothetical protein
MVEQLQHGPLHFSISRLIVIEPFCPDSIDLVDKDDRRSLLLGKSKSVSDHFWTITNVHLYEVGASQFQESSFSLSSACSSHHCLPCSWRTKHQTSFWGSDTDILKLLLVGNWQHYSLSKLLDLLIESSDVCVLFRRSLLKLHGFHP